MAFAFFVTALIFLLAASPMNWSLSGFLFPAVVLGDGGLPVSEGVHNTLLDLRGRPVWDGIGGGGALTDAVLDGQGRPGPASWRFCRTDRVGLDRPCCPRRPPPDADRPAAEGDGDVARRGDGLLGKLFLAVTLRAAFGAAANGGFAGLEAGEAPLETGAETVAAGFGRPRLAGGGGGGTFAGEAAPLELLDSLDMEIVLGGFVFLDELIDAEDDSDDTETDLLVVTGDPEGFRMIVFFGGISVCFLLHLPRLRNESECRDCRSTPSAMNHSMKLVEVKSMNVHGLGVGPLAGLSSGPPRSAGLVCVSIDDFPSWLLLLISQLITVVIGEHVPRSRVAGGPFLGA